MTATQLKQLLIALFTLIFIIGFIVNRHHAYFAMALVIVLSMIVYVGGKVDKENTPQQNEDLNKK